MDLDSELQELIKLGESWGMSKTEINACLQAELIQEGKSPSKASKPESSSVGRFVKFVLLGSLLFLALLLLFVYLVTTITTISPAVEVALGKIGQPYVYTFMSHFRRNLKPFADKYDIAAYYNSECIVKNPLFVDPVGDCWPCMEKKEFAEVPADHIEEQMNNANDFRPFVIRTYQTPSISLTDIQTMISNNKHRFKGGGITDFYSNVQSINNITDILEGNSRQLAIANKGAAHIFWETNSVPTAQAIRKLFPRPAFVPDMAEVALMKRVFIDGPLAGKYDMSIGSFANVWYQQAKGSRRLTLIPHPDCAEDCHSFSLVVNEGDLVSYQDQFWSMVSSPVHKYHKDELSIAFTSSFTF